MAHYRRDLERRNNKIRQEAEELRKQEEKNRERSLDFNPPQELESCVYCGSARLTAINDSGKHNKRYHCNSCNTSVSNTVGTLAHKSHLSPETIKKLHEAYKQGKSVREAAEIVGVNKNTVQSWYRDKFDYTEAHSEIIQNNNVEATYQTTNSYANHPSYKSQVDSKTTSEMIRKGTLNVNHYVDNKGAIRDGMNRVVDSI